MTANYFDFNNSLSSIIQSHNNETNIQKENIRLLNDIIQKQQQEIIFLQQQLKSFHNNFIMQNDVIQKQQQEIIFLQQKLNLFHDNTFIKNEPQQEKLELESIIEKLKKSQTEFLQNKIAMEIFRQLHYYTPSTISTSFQIPISRDNFEDFFQDLSTFTPKRFLPNTKDTIPKMIETKEQLHNLLQKSDIYRIHKQVEEFLSRPAFPIYVFYDNKNLVAKFLFCFRVFDTLGKIRFNFLSLPFF